MSNPAVRRFAWGGLFVAFGIAVLISPFASESPDGLERVAEDKGFLEREAASQVYSAPAPDYMTPGIDTEWLSTPIAGAAGTLLTFGLALGLAQLVARRGNRKPGS